MDCTEYQQSISRLRDGELSRDDSATVFAHLSTCTECRAFFFELQALDSAMHRIADRVPAEAEARPLSLPAAVTAGSWWDRRVALRVPVFTLLLCAIVLSLAALLPGSPLSREPQAIYVTQLPTVVVVDAATAPPEPRQ
jgi:anti-sigma factor RsiW